MLATPEAMSIASAPRTPPSAGFARAHEHGGEMVRLHGQQGLDSGDLRIGRTALDAWSRRFGNPARVLTVVEEEDAPDLTQRDVIHAPGDIASCRREKARKQ